MDFNLQFKFFYIKIRNSKHFCNNFIKLKKNGLIIKFVIYDIIIK